MQITWLHPGIIIRLCRHTGLRDCVVTMSTQSQSGKFIQNPWSFILYTLNFALSCSGIRTHARPCTGTEIYLGELGEKHFDKLEINVPRCLDILFFYWRFKIQRRLIDRYFDGLSTTDLQNKNHLKLNKRSNVVFYISRVTTSS